MRLGFDLDGTIADLQSALAREARKISPQVDPKSLPQSAPPTDPSATDEPARPSGTDVAPLNGVDRRALWKAVCDQKNFWETLDEIEPGALARLYRLVQDRKWELIFLTSRPETRGDSAQAQSYRWLVAHGFLTPSVMVVHRSRGKIAEALDLDVLVDDRPETCLDVSLDSKARAVLVWRGGAETVPMLGQQPRIYRVFSVSECLDILQSLDDRARRKPGLVERLKRLFDLRPSPSRA
jgi:hypothetical protein